MAEGVQWTCKKDCGNYRDCELQKRRVEDEQLILGVLALISFTGGGGEAMRRMVSELIGEPASGGPSEEDRMQLLHDASARYGQLADEVDRITAEQTVLAKDCPGPALVTEIAVGEEPVEHFVCRSPQALPANEPTVPST